MLLAALRRFLLLSLGISLATAVCTLLIGLLAGASLNRALYLGFYWIGALALLAGIFVGSRGPIRVKSESRGSSISSVPFFPFFGRGVPRWASQEEQEETINNSAVFVAVGIVLLLIGFLVDSRIRLF